MDPRAFRIAQAFVRAHVRQARYSREFLEWVERQKFRSPKTGDPIKFISLPYEEQARIHQQWAQRRQRPEEPESREQIEKRNLDIARNGEIIESEVLSTGGISGEPREGGVNQSYIVKLKHGDQEQVYIRKPVEGEEKHLRVGIPGGTYHAREQAAYEIDRMLGGDVVPATVTRGSDDGSYQLWIHGARALHGDDLEDVAEVVSIDELPKSPDFQRVNVLDLILGHEDRHKGNMLYYFEDGEEKPEKLRFVAIDNGLSLSSPNKIPDHHAYYHPFDAWYYEDREAAQKLMEQGEYLEAANLPRRQAVEAEKNGNKAVARALSDISPELQQQIRSIELDKVAESLVNSGVNEEGAVKATLMRIAALQENPEIFKQFLERAKDKPEDKRLEEAWLEFQYSSGQGDDLLARATDHLEPGLGAAVRRARKEQINETLHLVKPKQGWAPPEELENHTKAVEEELAKLDSWGIFEEGATEKAEAVTKRATVWDSWLGP